MARWRHGRLAARGLVTRQPRPIEGMPRPVCERCSSFLPAGRDMRRPAVSVRQRRGVWNRRFMNSSTNPPTLHHHHHHLCSSTWGAADIHFSSPSLTSIRRHSAFCPLPLHMADLTLKREREQSRKKKKVLCWHRPRVSMAASVFCPDYRSVWIVLQRWWWGISLPFREQHTGEVASPAVT